MASQGLPRRRLQCKTPPPVAVAEAVGDSSGAEEDMPSAKTRRVECGQFVWPCPREYPAEKHERKKQKWMIPADLTKEEFGLLFKEVCAAVGQAPNLDKLLVFDEPHKRYNKVTGVRERHKHLVFKMKARFAHGSSQKALA